MMNSILNLKTVEICGVIPEGLGNGMLMMWVEDSYEAQAAAQLLECAAFAAKKKAGYVCLDGIISQLLEGTNLHEEEGVAGWSYANPEGTFRFHFQDQSEGGMTFRITNNLL